MAAGLTRAPKFPARYPGSEQVRPGRRQLRPSAVIPTTFSAEQRAFIDEHARRERIPRQFIVRRCVQAMMREFERLWGAHG